MGHFAESRHTRSVSLEGGLADVELGRFGRSSWSSLLVEVVQDSANDRGLGDEGENFHLFPASTTGQRVDLVDTEDKLGPSLFESASQRGRFILCLPFRRVVTNRSRRTHAMGIGAVEMDEMSVGLGDVDEHTS